jgi:glycosyltransferase involved in cell wall biosynthesis
VTGVIEYTNQPFFLVVMSLWRTAVLSLSLLLFVSGNPLRDSNATLVSCSKNAQITFLMPTSGTRSSIQGAIGSLLAMKTCEWRLIVVYSTTAAVKDHLEDFPSLQLGRFSQSFENDPRIFYLPYQRLSSFNFGGSSRNAAMKHVTTEWISFLDDDDALSADFLTVFRNDTHSYRFISVILYRLARGGGIIPPAAPFEFQVGNVGKRLDDTHSPSPSLSLSLSLTLSLSLSLSVSLCISLSPCLSLSLF